MLPARALKRNVGIHHSFLNFRAGAKKKKENYNDDNDNKSNR